MTTCVWCKIYHPCFSQRSCHLFKISNKIAGQGHRNHALKLSSSESLSGSQVVWEVMWYGDWSTGPTVRGSLPLVLPPTQIMQAISALPVSVDVRLNLDDVLLLLQLQDFRHLMILFWVSTFKGTHVSSTPYGWEQNTWSWLLKRKKHFFYFIFLRKGMVSRGRQS